jgi:hypothetical protein
MKLRYFLPMALLASTITTASAQQTTPELNIPNGNFEVWDNGLPAGWGGLNIPGYETITQSEDAKSGESSLHGVTLPAIIGEGSLPCIVMTAKGDVEDPMNFTPGFPYTSRPSSLVGYLKTSLKPNDTLTIVAAFMHGEDSVGGGLIQITSNSNGYTKFTVPLQYSSDYMPDTAMVAIFMGSEAAAPGSEFWLDDISFSSEVADVAYENRESSLEVVYGGNRYIQATFHNTDAVDTKLEVLDVNGRIVETLHEGLAGSASVRWQTERVNSGVYLIKLTRPTGVVTKKVFVAH